MTRRSICSFKGIISIILISALAILTAGCHTAPSTSTSQGAPVVRKNVKDLTDAEKSDFVAAIKKLKTTPAPDDPRVGNWYDHFVAEHMSKLMCWTDSAGQGGYGHYGPDLLTWHRAYLREFEEALTTVAGKPMALPYWDWTDPASTAAVFADDFMGPPGAAADDYVVTRGPFRKGEWRIDVKGSTFTNPGQFDDLVRATGMMPGMTSLPPAADVRAALTRPVYDTAPWDPSSNTDQSFRSYVDGAIGATGQACENGGIAAVGATSGRLHATVHMYVGGMNAEGQPGALTDTATSPNEPIFWLHHVNIDRIAEAWWSAHDYQYLPTSGGPRGDNIDDVVWPFRDKTNGDMATPASQLGYTYDQLPSA
ncbi:tyrosinase family protein [Mycolicibacterium hodleri]|uniref:Tyrosinase copper-binding domain-containing protein n=1 Tax=Mycolicibacterium hodleri TaxID=49897 RepID=A0A502E729_9MYCO|nr:tyrosinase family protein [Mycolicibacterium hodleri]TPG33473.1 hypothetical protein EAH80_14325 [Mycolicibacterium hodleri]